MKRLAGISVLALLLVLLVSCSTNSAYCQSVRENSETLQTFGKDRTTKAYTRYADALDAIAAEAPDSVAKDWQRLAKVTRGVLSAQKKAGVRLEQLRNDKAVAELTAEQRSALNRSYQAFNGTAKERTAVVEDVKNECNITLQ